MLLLGSAAHALTPFRVVSVSPNSSGRAALTQPVIVTFNAATTNGAGRAVTVHSMQRGGLGNVGNPAVRSGARVTYTPRAAKPYVPGELIWCSVPGIRSTNSGGTTTTSLQAQARSFVVAVAGTGRGNFTASTAPAPPVSPGTNHMATADVDGDNDLDLLATNGLYNSVSVCLNDGTGRYRWLADVPTGAGPQRVVTGDLDNDGDLDLAVVNTNNSISLRFNDGSGTFSASAARPDITSPLNWQDLMLGDMDGDGYLDLAASNTTTNEVWFFNNDRTGNFPTFQLAAMASGPGAVAVADMDGDYAMDLLAVNPTTNTVSISQNLSGPGFGTSARVAVGAGPVALAVADVNGDGSPDLLTANAGAGTTSVRLGNGTGTFTSGPDLPGGGAALAVNDLDADGDTDLVTADASGMVRVLLNNGRGTFAASSALPGFALGSPATQLILSDVDGDLDLDLIATVPGTNPIRVYLNNAAPLATRSSQATTLALFPNPARSEATLAGALPYAAVEVLDALGRPVLNASADANGTARLVLPAGLPTGVYVVRSGQQVRRLVVE